MVLLIQRRHNNDLFFLSLSIYNKYSYMIYHLDYLLYLSLKCLIGYQLIYSLHLTNLPNFEYTSQGPCLFIFDTF